MKSRLMLLARIGLAFAVVTGCAPRETMDPPRCENGSVLLAAQSVPTAEMIPCFSGLPEGWSFSTVQIDQDGTVVELDSDRAGSDAATLRFTERCDPSRAVSVPSDLEEADRFDDIERLEPGFRARTVYLFEGGCVSWRFDFDHDASATESVALEGSLMLLSRENLNANIRDTFIDVDL